MFLTRQDVHALFNNGAPNAPQRLMLGLPSKLEHGWLEALVDAEIAESDYDHLLSIKGPRPSGMKRADWMSVAPITIKRSPKRAEIAPTNGDAKKTVALSEEMALARFREVERSNATKEEKQLAFNDWLRASGL